MWLPLPPSADLPPPTSAKRCALREKSLLITKKNYCFFHASLPLALIACNHPSTKVWISAWERSSETHKIALDCSDNGSGLKMTTKIQLMAANKIPLIGNWKSNNMVAQNCIPTTRKTLQFGESSCSFILYLSRSHLSSSSSKIPYSFFIFWDFIFILLQAISHLHN